MNNLRVRHLMQPSYRWFLPSGTSSNEALHAEIHSWSRSINVMHRSTLAMKLMYLRYIKLLLPYLSVEFPLSHVVSASMLLGRSLHTSLWHGDDWVAWCSEQSTGGVPQKALLTLSTARKHEANLVHQHVLRKTSFQEAWQASRQETRHPFVRHPTSHIAKCSGVKSRHYK